MPDPEGDRERNGVIFRKFYSLHERYELLQKKFPQFLVYDHVLDEQLCEIPTKAVKKHYKPAEYLRELRHSVELDKIEEKTLQFAKLLKEATSVPWNKIGISGSILIKLHRPESDIDQIIYGTKNCRKVYDVLKILHKDESPVKSYNLEDLRKLFAFRSKDTVTPFEDFVRTESRKALQGKFMGSDYFVRFVKDWNETTEKYGMIKYSNEGYAKIKANVVDDSEAIFTPCTYKIESTNILEGAIANVRIDEIVSFRGRFCEQAKQGETVIAQGKVECVQPEHERTHFRLLLGNKPSDYMVLVN